MCVLFLGGGVCVVIRRGVCDVLGIVVWCFVLGTCVCVSWGTTNTTPPKNNTTPRLPRTTPHHASQEGHTPRSPRTIHTHTPRSPRTTHTPHTTLHQKQHTPHTHTKKNIHTTPPKNNTHTPPPRSHNFFGSEKMKKIKKVRERKKSSASSGGPTGCDFFPPPSRKRGPVTRNRWWEIGRANPQPERANSHHENIKPKGKRKKTEKLKHLKIKKKKKKKP